NNIKLNNLSLFVCDALGNAISTQQINSKKVRFERNNLPAGLYFYYIKDKDNNVLGQGKMAIQ
ncbi:MAG: T9SS type A sorting domain-containing protein, partial [Bacteroidales bacterium]|nr:T9SS type A sorting domain-containing protein [Bacteroidales bacterium]